VPCKNRNGRWDNDYRASLNNDVDAWHAPFDAMSRSKAGASLYWMLAAVGKFNYQE
jgi:hypothetical protein